MKERKKEKRTYEQEPSGIYKKPKTCDVCGDKMGYRPTARIWLCLCGQEIDEEELNKFTDSIKVPIKSFTAKFLKK